MKHDWSDSGVHWNDSSKDADMARDWLANQRLYRIRPGDPSVPEGYSLDLDDRVLELMITGLDPERGWQLLLALLRLAEDEGDVTQVAHSCAGELRVGAP